MLNIHLAHLGTIIIEGEISELNESQGRWLFITIKDESASVSVFGVMYQLSGWKSLEVGMRVHVYGVPRIHQKSGRFSITAERIVPAGEGALKLAFEKLKAQLTNEGIFDDSRKRALPPFPQKVGLVTAKGSQAYNDFVKILKDRMGGIHIYFAPVTVQGDSAPQAIIDALKYFNTRYKDLDAIVVCRGGGSLEDLQAFNDEHVVRAIFASKIPVICGVGHEGDVSLADLVADIRASTPTHAAELLIEERETLLQRVDLFIQRIQRLYLSALSEHKHAVSRTINRLEHAMRSHIQFMQHTVDRFYSVSAPTYKNAVSKSLDRYTYLSRTLTNLDYTNLLEKGFSITRNQEGTIIRSVQSVDADTTIQTALSDGTIYSHVNKTEKN